MNVFEDLKRKYERGYKKMDDGGNGERGEFWHAIQWDFHCSKNAHGLLLNSKYDFEGLICGGESYENSRAMWRDSQRVVYSTLERAADFLAVDCEVLRVIVKLACEEHEERNKLEDAIKFCKEHCCLLRDEPDCERGEGHSSKREREEAVSQVGAVQDMTWEQMLAAGVI